jgi:hypothetical protein
VCSYIIKNFVVFYGQYKNLLLPTQTGFKKKKKKKKKKPLCTRIHEII